MCDDNALFILFRTAFVYLQLHPLCIDEYVDGDRATRNSYYCPTILPPSDSSFSCSLLYYSCFYRKYRDFLLVNTIFSCGKASANILLLWSFDSAIVNSRSIYTKLMWLVYLPILRNWRVEVDGCAPHLDEPSAVGFLALSSWQYVSNQWVYFWWVFRAFLGYRLKASSVFTDKSESRYLPVQGKFHSSLRTSVEYCQVNRYGQW